MTTPLPDPASGPDGGRNGGINSGFNSGFTGGPNSGLDIPDEITQQRYAMALPSGSLLNGKFEVLNVIGKPGGFGIAYSCLDQRLGRHVVVKELFPVGLVQRVRGSAQVQVLESSLASDFELQLQLMQSEARKLAALDKVAAVVRVFEYFTQNNTAYIVMQQVPGRPLSDWLRDGKKVSVAQLMRWLWPLLQGLQAVHGAGVLHRDVKPDNVLIDANDQPVLIDFGNAAALSEHSAHSDRHFAVSRYYGAPEQYANDLKQMGPWTDIYSVGALMYTALCGKRPADALKRLAGQPLVPVLQLASDVPLELARTVEACLELMAQRRPADVSELCRRLLSWQPMAHHWTEALPDNRFGARMRGVHQHLQAGHALPGVWHWPAGLGQGFWCFVQRLTLPGLVWTALGSLLVVTVSALTNSWPAMALALAGFWLLAALPMARTADWMCFRQLRQSAETQPMDSPEQRQRARQRLTVQGQAAWHLAPWALLLPVVVGVAALGAHLRQQSHREAVDQAIDLAGVRQQFLQFVVEHARPPGLADLPPFTPNAEIKTLEIRPSGLEVVLALPEVAGRRLRWRLDEAANWHCEAVDLPAAYVPARCRLL